MVMNNGPQVPGTSFGRPGEMTQPVRTVTARRMVPIGPAGMGRTVYGEIQTAVLAEDGTLTVETQIQVATCAGMGDLMKSEAEAGAMCMFDGFIVCVRCAPLYRCACGRQVCARCATGSAGAVTCPVCLRESNKEGGPGWLTTQIWELGPGNLPMQTAVWQPIRSVFQWGT